MKIIGLVLALAASAATTFHAQDRSPDATASPGGEPQLSRTVHRLLPVDASDYWLVPDSRAVAAGAARGIEDSVARFARGVGLMTEGRFSEALPLVQTQELASSPLADYAQYYTGVALAELSRLEEADATLGALALRARQGYLHELLTLRLADVALARGDSERAEDLLEELSEAKLSVPEEVFLRLGRAEEAVGHQDHALQVYRRVYYDFPLSVQASFAQDGIERLRTPALIMLDRFARELARAEVLFAAQRWAQARAGFEPLARVAQGEDGALVALRLAECDYYLNRHRATRDALKRFLDGGPREAEARFFHLTAVRALGDQQTYVALARGLVADHPGSDWAAETLNNLASHYLANDQVVEADAIFRELLRRVPRHRHAERASWKAGWFAYRNGRFPETVDIFERAAATFPRGDNRPAWLYWSGRARDQMGDTSIANQRYRLVVADYQNSYYGRLAATILEGRRDVPAPDAVSAVAVSPVPATVPTAALIRALNAAGLYDEALAEVQYAQRVWGDSPQLLATVAWIRHRQGFGLRETERFNALRGAITLMRRAYPQFMAAGGEDLPPEVLRIIFPLDFWPLITKYSKTHSLDPYLLAALMAQESTFTPEIRSSANAYGLMQVIPPTGRQVARQLGIPRFSTSMLTQPETNVRIGTKYFKDMVERFGGEHFALAGYNAGPHRVVTWLKEAPGLAQDEFIDNIPFTETQAYVKRILGTAEDYRRLYGEDGLLDPRARLDTEQPAAAKAAAKPAATPAAKPAARPAAKPASPPRRAPARKPAPSTRPRR